MLSSITVEELGAALDAAVVEVLEKAQVDAPPVDALAVARGLGLTVTTDDRQQGRARYVRLRGLRGRASCPTVVLRPEPRQERCHWAVAHEIGEHVAHRVFRQLDVDARTLSPRAREAVANQMAGRLLLPTAWFAADALAGDYDLLNLKSRYSTASHELIARRMLELSAPAVMSIFDQGRLYFRRSNVPGRVPGVTGDESRCWEKVHHGAAPHEVAAAAGRVRGWPVHEPGWQREILRLELACEMAWEGNASPGDEPGFGDEQELLFFGEYSARSEDQDMMGYDS